MNKKLKITLALGVATLLFTGCGGGSSDTDTQTTTSIDGKVADGYLNNAKVCLDKNENGKCDTDEPNTLSINGNYQLKNVTTADIGKYPILVEVTTNTIDLDDGNAIVNGYTLTAPKDSTSFISPITTLLKNEIDKCPVLTTEEATSKVATKLNLTSNDTKLLTDYVANNSDTESSKLHEVAKVVATLQGALEQKITQNGTTITNDNKKAVVNQILNNIYTDIHNTSTQIRNGTLASAINTTTKVNSANITADDISISVKDLDLKESGTIDKFSGLKNAIYFGFEHNENTNDIEIEAAVFDDDSWDFGRAPFSDGTNAINNSKSAIGNATPITTNADGEIEYTNENLKHPRFSLIPLQGKSYTVKEIITIMQDGYSVELSELDSSKLSNTINFTDDSDKFYMFIVKTKSTNQYVRSICKNRSHLNTNFRNT